MDGCHLNIVSALRIFYKKDKAKRLTEEKDSGGMRDSADPSHIES